MSVKALYVQHQFIIKTTPAFDKKAKKILTAESIESLFDYLEARPEKGDLIKGTGGVRKLRWQSGKSNKGKSGGVRVLYYYEKDVLIILITLYRKSEKDDISSEDRNQLKKLMPQLIAKYKEGL
jgi:mRNA-degrading endonuclease RelE of RelBE toxin-antitoxin system